MAQLGVGHARGVQLLSRPLLNHDRHHEIPMGPPHRIPVAPLCNFASNSSLLLKVSITTFTCSRRFELLNEVRAHVVRPGKVVQDRSSLAGLAPR